MLEAIVSIACFVYGLSMCDGLGLIAAGILAIAANLSKE